MSKVLSAAIDDSDTSDTDIADTVENKHHSTKSHSDRQSVTDKQSTGGKKQPQASTSHHKPAVDDDGQKKANRNGIGKETSLPSTSQPDSMKQDVIDQPTSSPRSATERLHSEKVYNTDTPKRSHTGLLSTSNPDHSDGDSSADYDYRSSKHGHDEDNQEAKKSAGQGLYTACFTNLKLNKWF